MKVYTSATNELYTSITNTWGNLRSEVKKRDEAFRQRCANCSSPTYGKNCRKVGNEEYGTACNDCRLCRQDVGSTVCDDCCDRIREAEAEYKAR